MPGIKARTGEGSSHTLFVNGGPAKPKDEVYVSDAHTFGKGEGTVLPEAPSPPPADQPRPKASSQAESLKSSSQAGSQSRTTHRTDHKKSPARLEGIPSTSSRGPQSHGTREKQSTSSESRSSSASQDRHKGDKHRLGSFAQSEKDSRIRGHYYTRPATKKTESTKTYGILGEHIQNRMTRSLVDKLDKVLPQCEDPSPNLARRSGKGQLHFVRKRHSVGQTEYGIFRR